METYKKDSSASIVKYEFKETRSKDCTEVFVETPSSLESGTYLWSDYKHHHTFKFLIVITLSSEVSLIWPCNVGRTSDVLIIRGSRFLELLDPYNTVMADRGFKKNSELALRRCYLAIHPSTAKRTQMIASDVSTARKVASIRIFVQKPIAWIKWFRTLSTELSVLLLVDDMVIVCSALLNILPPLQKEQEAFYWKYW